jgi:hypothetical protein
MKNRTFAESKHFEKKNGKVLGQREASKQNPWRQGEETHDRYAQHHRNAPRRKMIGPTT